MRLPSVIDQIDRLFDELVHRPWRSGSVKPVQIREVEDGWMIEVPVEGMQANDVSVEVHGRQLVVRGLRQEQRVRRGATGGLAAASSTSSFVRTIQLPVEAHHDDLDIQLQNSTLTIHLRRRRP